MNLDDLQHELAEIANSGDPAFVTFAQQINDTVEQAKSGGMSAAETKEILEDAQRQLTILDNMSQLSLKEKLNTIITGLIIIVSTI